MRLRPRHSKPSRDADEASRPEQAAPARLQRAPRCGYRLEAAAHRVGVSSRFAPRAADVRK